MSGSAHTGGEHDDVVVRRAEHGWVVGDEEVSDLTSAMVLADLLAADHAVAGQSAPRSAASPQSAPSGAPATSAPPAASSPAQDEADEAARLAVTVAQLEHALASRVTVEQAIGVLAERHRLRPREAFGLLRSAARSRGLRLTEIAKDVVSSAANPLLRLPEELARKLPAPHSRGRSRRRGRHEQAQPN
jgi:ANTAR domain